MNDDEVRLKKSVIFRNSLPEIENKIRQGMTMKDIADGMGFKLDTFKKYYQRFKNKKSAAEDVNQPQFSHAKIDDEKNIECEREVPKNDSQSLAPSFKDALDPEKRAADVSEFMQQKKPFSRGKK